MQIVFKTELMPHREREAVIQQKIDETINELKELREKKGITTARLAELSGIAQPNITRMETGAAKPNLKTIITIADALGVDLKFVRRKNEQAQQ